MTFRLLNPEAFPANANYLHLAVVPPGATVHVAGQIAVDASGALVGTGDLGRQTELVEVEVMALVPSGR
jgi:enamine deaminase RidA (YjgF/YER057c/UK114 family)